MMKTNLLIAALVISSASMTLCAQDKSPMAQDKQPITVTQDNNNVPVFHIEVVGRDIPTINYFHRSGGTQIGFEGTSLLPQAKGSATVVSKGQTSVDAKFEGMVPANSFGVEYLTYVLWAITPQGRPMNLGEVMPSGSKAEMHVTTGLQQFALIVTAEPYFAVSMPSDLVVLQNTIKKNGTSGILDTVNAHYNLLPRGAYVEATDRHAVLNPVKPSDKSPLQLYEAINAVQIAEAAGAAKYTPDILDKAKLELTNAQGLDTHKSQNKMMITYARGAVQDAEDARVSTLRKIDEEKQQQQVLAMQQAQQAAEEAQLAAKQQAAQRAQADAQAAQANAQAAQAKAQAELAEAKAAQAQAAQQSAQQATQQAEQVREKLRAQLNDVLQTRETARGLIVNMSDVLFAFNQYALKPDAREKLAKVSGILLAYPGLAVQVEGYTDNVGSEPYNLKLSQQRADAVHDYLVSQGVPAPNVTSTGYGMSNPVADNSTAAGRGQNRRVQLVVSGSSIGLQEAQPGVEGQAATPPSAPAVPQGAPAVPQGAPAAPQGPPPLPQGVSNPPQ